MTTEHAPKLTDRSVHSIGDSLREFGYSTLTDEYVREVADNLLAGKEQQETIIVKLVRSQLKEAGVLK